MAFLATVLLILSSAIYFLLKRRIFLRTNPMGIEQFPSFTGKLRARIVDWSLKVVSIMLCTAGVLILAEIYADSWGWVVLIPALAWGLFIFLGV